MADGVSHGVGLIRFGKTSTVGDNLILSLTLLVHVVRQPTPACAATRHNGVG